MPNILDIAGFQTLEIGFLPSYLETYLSGLFVKTGAGGLRFGSWLTRKQTMILAIAQRV